nr:ribonuclease Z [Candidatus Woesearchaeota archaeon]
MELVFLGTSSMMPTKSRNQISILLKYKDESILFDCGEGTQRQLRIANISPTKITKILISHWHSDHVLGLPGLISTLSASNYSNKLEIFGPKNSKIFISNMLKTFMPYDLIDYEVHEIKTKKFFESKDFYLEALPMNHGIPCLGYSFIEKDKRKINMDYLKKFNLKNHPIIKKLQLGQDIVWKDKKIKADLATKIIKGKKITFVTDTLPNDNIIKLAKNSDLFICEATHTKDIQEKTEKFKHMTAEQAAKLAKNANVKKLVLTHYSQRYKTVFPILEEAKKVFPETIASEDFKVVKV